MMICGARGGSATSQGSRVLARTTPLLAQERGLTLPVLIWGFLSGRQMRSTLACLPPPPYEAFLSPPAGCVGLG